MPFGTGTTVFISAPGGSDTLRSVQQAGANVGGADACADVGPGTWNIVVVAS
jgi:hypothetical protein